MQRMRNLALISGVVAVAVFAGALALAAYRREIVEEAEGHEHEFVEHHHDATDTDEQQPHRVPAPPQTLGDDRHEASEPALPAPSPPSAEPASQPAAERDHDHAHDDHHHH